MPRRGYYGNNIFSDDSDYEMHPSQTIYRLRREGKLIEAKNYAERYLDSRDLDIWMAYAWTIIDLCKYYLQEGDHETAEQFAIWLVNTSKVLFEPIATSVIDDIEDDDSDVEGRMAATLVRTINRLRVSASPYSDQIKEAEELSKSGNNDRALEILKPIAAGGHLPEQAQESYGWIIFRYLKAHYKAMTSVEVRTMLKDYLSLKNKKPSLLHSQILSFAINYSNEDKEFKPLAFFRMWGPQNVRKEDFYDSRGNEGIIPSIMSRIAKVVVNYPQTHIQEFVELLPLGKSDFIEMLKASFFWKIYRSADNDKPTASTWNLFDTYLDFFPEAPGCEAHSKVLDLAERWMKDENAYRFYSFFKKWNPAILMDADWKEKKGEQDGVVFKSLALKAIGSAKDATSKLSDEQVGDLQWLIDLYDTAMKKYPDDDWNARAKGCLLLKAGHIEDARKIYKDLCQKMGERSYIWQEYADCWDDNATKVALLCKAISVENSDDFIGKIRIELARQLIIAGKRECAAIELSRCKKHYQEKGWNVPKDVNNLLESCGGEPSDEKANNTALYEENIPLAEDIAFAGIPFTELVLVDVRKNERGDDLVTFTDGDQIELEFKKKRFPALHNSHKGQVWKLRVYEERKNVKYIPLVIAPSSTTDWGNLPIYFGFVQYVNTEKKVYHIFSTAGTLSYVHYGKQALNIGDFVKLRQYTKKINNENKVFFCDIRKCSPDEAIDKFPTMIVIVDDINEQKQLVHYIADNNVTGIISFGLIPLKTSVGDSLKLHYVDRAIQDRNKPRVTKHTIEVVKVENTSESNCGFVRTIQGELRVKYYGGLNYGNPDFAFIDGCYVHKSLLEKYKIIDDCYVEAKVIKQKDERWKVIDIIKFD